MTYKVLDLFSGIGGFSLGLERAGMETVAFCEIDPFCRKVLRKHWPDVPIYEDIRELTKETLDGITADVICGGYPCQPFSSAGKRAGEADDRHLWPEMYRVIEAVRPRWIIAENVAGHITLGLDDVLSDLEAAHYTWWTFVIPACAVDAQHRRDRVWIVAHPEDMQRNGGREHREPRKRQVPESGKPSCPQLVADASQPRLQGRAQTGHPGSQWTRSNQQPERCRDSARSAWLPEPSVGRVANGIPRRVDRLRSLGNAVVPQVVEVIGRAIMA